MLLHPPPLWIENPKVLFSVVLKGLKSLHSLHGVHEICMGLPPDETAAVLARAAWAEVRERMQGLFPGAADAQNRSALRLQKEVSQGARLYQSACRLQKPTGAGWATTTAMSPCTRANPAGDMCQLTSGEAAIEQMEELGVPGDGKRGAALGAQRPHCHCAGVRIGGWGMGWPLK